MCAGGTVVWYRCWAIEQLAQDQPSDRYLAASGEDLTSLMRRLSITELQTRSLHPQRRKYTVSAVLRQAVRSDLPDLLRVRYAVLENRPSRIIPDSQVIEALEVAGRGWVIELDGVIAAFAIGNAVTGSVFALFVDPAHQGHGYGRRLHDTVVEWLWSQGLDRIWLNTQPGTRAQRFYEKLGWLCCGPAGNGQLRLELLKRNPAVSRSEALG
jgi:GNAT superfamily N-acetyltransferase